MGIVADFPPESSQVENIKAARRPGLPESPAFLGTSGCRAVYKNGAAEPHIDGKTWLNSGTLPPLVWRVAPKLAYRGATREARRRVHEHEFCEGFSPSRLCEATPGPT